VSENDKVVQGHPYCHCAGTTEVAVKVMGMNARREKPWGNFGKQT